MNMKRMMVTAVIGAVLCGGAVFAEEQVTVTSSVVNTLRYSPRLEMIKSNREAVRSDLDASRGHWYPKLDIRGGVGMDAYSSEVTREAEEGADWDRRTELGASLTQRLYDGGEASSQIRLDERRLASLEHRVVDNAESLALDATIATLEVYRQRELLFLAEENVREHKGILASLRDRVQAGAGSVADVTQTEARLSMAQASLEKMQASLYAALAEYQRLTGTLPGKIDLQPYPADVLPATLEEMVSMARANNPKLYAAGEDAQCDVERIQIQKANYQPYVYGELSSAYTDGVQNEDDWRRTDAAMLRFNWNIFNGGSDVAATKAARWRLRQTRADMTDLKKSVESETRATWAQLSAATHEVYAYSSAVKSNQDTKEIYLEQFSVAQRSLLDVLDSENEVFQSSVQLVTSRVNQQLAAYKLMALSGKLLDGLGIDAAYYKDPLQEDDVPEGTVAP